MLKVVHKLANNKLLRPIGSAKAVLSSVAISIVTLFDCFDCSVAQLYTQVNKKELT